MDDPQSAVSEAAQAAALYNTGPLAIPAKDSDGTRDCSNAGRFPLSLIYNAPQAPKIAAHRCAAGTANLRFHGLLTHVNASMRGKWAEF
jgi:hypothetical protein